MCMSWFLQRPRDRAPPARRFASKPAPTSVSGQLCLCHCLDRLVGLAGDWVRASMCMSWFLQRPRDRAPPARRFASKGSAPPLAPTSVSGQLCLGDCLDRLVCLAWDRVRATRCMAGCFWRPRDRAPPARRFASKLCSNVVSGQLCLWDCLDRLVLHHPCGGAGHPPPSAPYRFTSATHCANWSVIRPSWAVNNERCASRNTRLLSSPLR